MAITGLLIVEFLIAHLAGNLLFSMGPDALNEYAKNLRELGPLLWLARIGLLLIIVMHINSAIYLTRLNRKAKPTSYQQKSFQKSSLASRTMGLFRSCRTFIYFISLSTSNFSLDAFCSF